MHDTTIANGAYPSPLWYHNFPKSVCTSVNEVVCHGIPDARPLQDGDIVNVDVSCLLNGYHGDLNETFCVGEVDAASKHLVKVPPSLYCLCPAATHFEPVTMLAKRAVALRGASRLVDLRLLGWLPWNTSTLLLGIKPQDA